MTTRQKPGVVRDAIISYLKRINGDASVTEIQAAVCEEIGREVPGSSVRSYLNINTPRTFTRTAHGRYRMAHR
jgi:site-specific DNA-methyltransferase (adenine-specific)